VVAGAIGMAASPAQAVAVATPAAATTVSTSAAKTSAGCTLKVYKPIAAGTDIFTGKKRVTYKVKISCPLQVPPGVYVQVQQKFYERDSNGDQLVGSKTSYQVMPVGGDHTFSVTRNLPDTEGGSEEMVQKARFYGVSLPVPSNVSYGPWVFSGVRSISN
jgi:hypothetical protein